MKSLPIRWQVALWAALATGVTLGLFALGTLINLYRTQIADVDHRLVEEAEEIAPLVTDRPTRAPFVDPDTNLAWVLVEPDGTILPLHRTLPDALAQQVAGSVCAQTYSREGLRWRARSFPHTRGTLVVAYNLRAVHDLLADLLLAYALSLPLAALAAASVGWWVAGRALKPVRALATAAQVIQSDRLDQRLPVPAARDEIRQLVVILNAMLARLEQSFAQSKRFAADASHELRTPLTIMRGEIEILLRHPATPTGHEEKLLSLQEEIARLDRVTEQLLLLARFDAHQIVIERHPVDFSRLVREAYEDAEPLAAAQHVVPHGQVDEGVRVLGDEQQLRRLLLNLLDNAARHNHPGGTLSCRLTVTDRSADLRIANTGPGIPPDQHSRVFQRFFRGDARRPGHGLGLSLCREIAHAHGGSLTLVATADPTLTEFQFTLALA